MPIPGITATWITAMNKRVFGYVCALVLLCAVFFFFRFYHLDRRFGFDWDQEKLSYDVRSIIVDRKLTLLGPRANNDRGFFLGPQFTYLLIPFYLAARMHPSALMYFVITYCLAFFAAALLFVKRIFGLKTSLLFLFMWSLNSLLIGADISPFWPILIPLTAITIWFLLYKTYASPEKHRWWLFLGLAVGFALNIHFQAVFLLAYVALFLFLSRKKTGISLAGPAYFVAGIAAMFVPLLFFDLRHGFFNTKLFFTFFMENGAGQKLSPLGWLPVFSHIATTFLFVRNELAAGILLYAAIGFFAVMNRRGKTGFTKLFYTAFVFLWLAFPPFFSLYGKRPSEYYFFFLYPFIIGSIVDFFTRKKRHLFLIPYLLAYAVFNGFALTPKLQTSGMNFYEKDRAIKRISQVLTDKRCDIAFNVPWGWEVGYRYLFDYYGIKRIGDWKSCVININIPPGKTDEKFDYLGVAFPKELKQNR